MHLLLCSLCTYTNGTPFSWCMGYDKISLLGHRSATAAYFKGHSPLYPFKPVTVSRLVKSAAPFKDTIQGRRCEYWCVNVCAIFRRFKFLPMVEASRLLIYNTPAVHTDIMLPWIQCSLTHDCILPIGKAICNFYA